MSKKKKIIGVVCGVVAVAVVEDTCCSIRTAGRP